MREFDQSNDGAKKRPPHATAIIAMTHFVETLEGVSPNTHPYTKREPLGKFAAKNSI
jgi:hypothetical protein